MSTLALLAQYTVVRVRDTVVSTLASDEDTMGVPIEKGGTGVRCGFDRCGLCGAKLMPEDRVHCQTYDVPLHEEDDMRNFVLLHQDCVEKWIMEKSWEFTAQKRVILPPELEGVSKYIQQYGLIPLNIARDHPECPRLVVLYGGPDSSWLTIGGGEKMELASYCMSMPKVAAPFVPVRPTAFTRDAFPSVFQHRSVYTLRVGSYTSDDNVDASLKQWIFHTLESSFEESFGDARANLLTNFGNDQFGVPVTKIGQVLNISAFKHAFIDPREPRSRSYRVIVRVQLEPVFWERMYLSFRKSFLDGDGDAQIINNDQMMWAELFEPVDLKARLAAKVHLRLTGTEVDVGVHTRRMVSDRQSWFNNWTTRRMLIRDALDMVMRYAMTKHDGNPNIPNDLPNFPPDAFERIESGFVSDWEEVRVRQGPAVVDMWQYRVNVQKISNFITEQVVYIETEDGKELHCFRLSDRPQQTEFSYVPYFCGAGISAGTLFDELKLRGFVEASEIRPTVLIPL